ncbi:hypothetical protein HELRODRAFT_166939 [Helobdella robusta]|uniref:Uncharacterized protein n=1 Tax=Helobdella robusta TaxID=6412 RepID=T1EYS2_HELRO|nr:hypothetical protein HELRODRAFT_166939 [Helobdella robusta]ESO11863.1 hypothetical protein HELRODRAFT_166939 [Helobdella robusta]
MVTCHSDGIAFTRCQPPDRKRSESIDLLQADKQEQQHETQVENLFLTIIQAKSRNELIEIIQPTFQQQHQQQFLQKKLEEAKLQQPNKLLPEHHIPIFSSNVDAMQNDKQHKHNFGQTGTTIDFGEKQMNEDSLTEINSALSCLRYTIDEEKKQKDASPKHSEVEERLPENTDEVKSSEENLIELTIVEGRHKVTIEQKSSSNPFLINSLNNENEENKDQTNCHPRDLFEQKQVENESKKDFDVDVDIEKDNQTVIQQNLNQVNKENCSQHQYDIPQNTMNSSTKQLINAFDCITTKRKGDAICGHHQNEDDQSIYPPNNHNPVDRQNLLKQQNQLQQCESEPQVIMPLLDETHDKQSDDEIISKSEENMKQSSEPVVIKKQLDEGQRSTVTSQLLDNETVEIRTLGSHKSSDNIENFNEISDIKSFACNQETNILEMKLDCSGSTSIKLEDVEVRESVEEVMKEEPPPTSLTSSSSLSTPSSVDSLVSKAASKDIHRSARKQPEVKSFVEAASHRNQQTNSSREYEYMLSDASQAKHVLGGEVFVIFVPGHCTHCEAAPGDLNH